jgi:hypothetical protein
MIHAGFLPDLFFNLEDWQDMFHRNVGQVSTFPFFSQYRKAGFISRQKFVCIYFKSYQPCSACFVEVPKITTEYFISQSN